MATKFVRSGPLICLFSVELFFPRNPLFLSFPALLALAAWSLFSHLLLLCSTLYHHLLPLVRLMVALHALYIVISRLTSSCLAMGCPDCLSFFLFLSFFFSFLFLCTLFISSRYQFSLRRNGLPISLLLLGNPCKTYQKKTKQVGILVRIFVSHSFDLIWCDLTWFDFLILFSHHTSSQCCIWFVQRGLSNSWKLIRGFSLSCFIDLKVARDSCDVTQSLKQASIHTSHVHASKSCTKYSLHLVQSKSTH